MTAPRRRALSLAEIAGQLYRTGGIVGAMTHVSFHDRWVTADFTVGVKTRRWPIDALRQPGGSRGPGAGR